MLASEWAQAGLADVTLAVGFEEMSKYAMTVPRTPPVRE
jgi:acetyl-CoA acetyltransferase